MKTFRIAVWDNGDQHFDARNPSKKLMEMEVTVFIHDTSSMPNMPLMQALKTMYPSSDVEIVCSEKIVTSKKDIQCPVIQ